ncbi:tyrosine-type recombinase/integrase [Streptomyces phytophilus]|uniref:tyrosine-type recombinase/integrase n=1 Tax=Streptomyces phytophilus TaxID=722715 RepID=UPI002867CEFF|nr:tyrosine-type recombinase/integrase [Streptomyces phytophilus]
MWHPSRHIFTTAQGGSIDPTNPARTFTALLRKAGPRRIRFHDLRHLALGQGVELIVIKDLLGHADIGVTATVYAHAWLRLQHDAVHTLSSAPGSLEKPRRGAPTATTPPHSFADAAVNCYRHGPREPRLRALTSLATCRSAHSDARHVSHNVAHELSHPHGLPGPAAFSAEVVRRPEVSQCEAGGIT